MIHDCMHSLLRIPQPFKMHISYCKKISNEKIQAVWRRFVDLIFELVNNTPLKRFFIKKIEPQIIQPEPQLVNLPSIQIKPLSIIQAAETILTDELIDPISKASSEPKTPETPIDQTFESTDYNHLSISEIQNTQTESEPIQQSMVDDWNNDALASSKTEKEELSGNETAPNISDKSGVKNILIKNLLNDVFSFSLLEMFFIEQIEDLKSFQVTQNKYVQAACARIFKKNNELEAVCRSFNKKLVPSIIRMHRNDCSTILCLEGMRNTTQLNYLAQEIHLDLFRPLFALADMIKDRIATLPAPQAMIMIAKTIPEYKLKTCKRDLLEGFEAIIEEQESNKQFFSKLNLWLTKRKEKIISQVNDLIEDQTIKEELIEYIHSGTAEKDLLQHIEFLEAFLSQTDTLEKRRELINKTINDFKHEKEEILNDLLEEIKQTRNYQLNNIQNFDE